MSVRLLDLGRWEGNFCSGNLGGGEDFSFRMK
ncbi:hypothetical protein A2U01_0065575, partial [Trifolium medium]|nr:hypothetical protein [Trifolium medium]